MRTIVAAPGARLTRVNPASAFGAIGMFELLGPKYTCGTSAPGREPVFFSVNATSNPVPVRRTFKSE